MEKADIGLIGLAVMGENLALNMEGKGFTVAVYNRSFPGEEGVVDRFISGRGKGKNFIGTHSIRQLADSLSSPRKIMMMVKAGSPVDELIGQLVPFLSPGDVLIDGGNSDFHDTERRVKELESKGMYFVGSGISGGEIGALHGPSIMPGGSPAAWSLVKNILQSIAARLEDDTPCCEWIGSGGAGHFVKMVHNGIEYGDMQLISEAYALLKNRLGMDNEELAHVFSEWNQGELNSYLIEITADILRHQEKDGSYLLDKILDVAGQKGTGKWSAVAAMDENDPLTLITQAVYARMLSARQAERQKASALYPRRGVLVQTAVGPTEIKQALYAAKLISYAQGFSLLRQASKAYGWDLDYSSIARIWRKGCIIRSAFLQKITAAYEKNPELENLLFDDFFREEVKSSMSGWRIMVAEAALRGIAIPAMSAGLNYFDGLSTLHSAANLIQAQRDYFGAHTYERVDWERGKFFHTDWTGQGGTTVSGTYNA